MQFKWNSSVEKALSPRHKYPERIVQRKKTELQIRINQPAYVCLLEIALVVLGFLKLRLSIKIIDVIFEQIFDL